MAGPDPLKPKPDPKIGLPQVFPGINRIAPRTLKPDPGQKGAGVRNRKRRAANPDEMGGPPAW